MIGARFSRARAGELRARGLRRVQDAWNYDQIRFLSCDEVAEKFDLTAVEFGAWDEALAIFKAQWSSFLSGHAEFLREYEHVGWFHDANDELPFCVVAFQNSLCIPLKDQGRIDVWIPLSSLFTW